MGGRGDAELRALPAVHELAAELDAPHALAVVAARRAIDEQRSLVISHTDGELTLLQRARGHLAALSALSLRPVINATGVILHTNLGRAPLAPTARQAVIDATDGYANLEFDVRTGARGSRHDHVDGLLCELTGAQGAMVVNNGAAAVLLATAALAGPGRAVLISRGQLIEIGGGFRIPDVIAQSGSTMIEIGTTNRTNILDYERALATAQIPVGAILRVHQSNFRTLGFVADVQIQELCRLGVPVIDDLGSGVLAGGAAIPALRDEPDMTNSLAAGTALVCCSGDKLLGGPQAGLLLGTSGAVAMARAHPLARALRIDKLSLAALEATLVVHRDPERARRELPVLAMLDADEETLLARARRLCDGIGPAAQVIWTVARAGGGALPLTELEGPAVALQSDLEASVVAARLRGSNPPVIARVNDGRVILDPRTLTEDQMPVVIGAAREALGEQ